VGNEKGEPGTCPEQEAPASVSQVCRLPGEVLCPVPWAPGSDTHPGWEFGEG